MLTLILLVALAVCTVVVAWNVWQLAKADSLSAKIRPSAKITAGVGGALFVLPLLTEVHGWGLELFLAGGIICLACYLFLLYKSPGAITGRSDQ
jgi:hypothetical protein